MSRYAYDQHRHALVVTWEERPCSRALTVVEADPPADAVLVELAGQLTALSDALWATYTGPLPPIAGEDPGAALDRVDHVEALLARVLVLLTAPPVPGTYTEAVDEHAHRVARLLAGADPSLRAAVSAEVGVEVAAVRDAARGDLTGRARQAVLISRPVTAPTQVAAADDLLRTDPFGPPELFESFDPASAAAAAARCLHRAVLVTAEESRIDPYEVPAAAHDLHPLPLRTVRTVTGRLLHGDGAEKIVVDLIADALAVAAGVPRNVSALRDHLDRSAADSARTHIPVEELARLCVLDPSRPAPDLLEDLTAGVHGCLALYDEYADNEPDPAVAADPDGPDPAMVAYGESFERFKARVSTWSIPGN